MYYRQHILHDAETLSADKTLTLDLVGLGKISEILIAYKATNNGATPTAHPAKCITSIKVIDGSDTLVNLSGVEAQAIEYWGCKRVPYNLVSWYDNQVSTALFRIPFGRWLWDELLAFDTAMFKNPQLKIAVDLNGGGSAPDAGSIEVVLNLFDGRIIQPTGFLMSKEWKSFSPADSSWEQTVLPKDYKLRGVMLQSIADTKQPYEQYHDVKLSENGDKSIIFENNVSDLLKMLQNDWPMIVENHEGALTTSAVKHYIMAHYNESAMLCGLGSTAVYVTGIKNFGGEMGVKGNASGYWQGAFSGFNPHGSLWLPCGQHNDVDFWLDTKMIERLVLDVKGGSSVGSSSTTEIVVQQLRNY